MIDSKWWCWESPVWLVIVALLAGYVIVARGATRAQRAVFTFGLVVLAMAFVSPIGVLSDGYLFSAHMVQHLLLLLVVPGCLVLSVPKQRAAEWFGRPWSDRVGRVLAIAAVGWVCGVGAMWFWHVPVLCSSAAQQPALGAFRDLTLVLAGVAFWWPIYAPRDCYRMHPLGGMVYLFSACLGCTLLGIYITFAPLSVCPVFAHPAGRIGILSTLYDVGLTPGVDQHLGGLLMWVPPCFLYIAAIISLLSRWYTVTGEEPAGMTTSVHPSGS